MNVCISLSSFQRTKAPQIRKSEPFGIPATTCCVRLASFPASLSFRWRPSGEPFNLMTPTLPCQPTFSFGLDFFRRSRARVFTSRGDELIVGVPNQGRPRWRADRFELRIDQLDALDRRHRVERIDHLTARSRLCQLRPASKPSRCSSAVHPLYGRPQLSARARTVEVKIYRTSTRRRSRWPFRNTITRPSMAWSSVMRPRSSVTRWSFT